MPPFPGTLILTDPTARKGLESKLHRFLHQNGLEGLEGGSFDPTLLRATHDALFNVWFPVDILPISNSLKQVAAAVSDGMFNAFISTALGPLLTGLTYPSQLPSTLYNALKSSADPAIVAMVTSSGGFGAPALDYEAHLRVFSLFFQGVFGALAIGYAQILRDAYLSCIYDTPLGDPIANIDPPSPFLPEAQMREWLKNNNPPIAPSRLRYDASNGVITHVDGEIDYIVVGSGPAGSTIARGLQAANKRVVVVERGPFVVWGSMATMSYPALMFENNQSVTADGSVMYRSGQTVGGGTAVNIDLAFPPMMEAISKHIAKWVSDGRIDASIYSPDNIAAAYAEVAAVVQPYQVQESQMNPDNRKLWDGAEAWKLPPSLYKLNRYEPGKSPSPVDDKHDAAVCMLYPALNDATFPLSVLPNALTDEVLIGKDGCATGITFTQQTPWNTMGNTIDDPCNLKIPVGAKVRISAKNVILSAGTLGSTRVLLNTAAANPALANPNIGVGVVVHPSFPIVGLFDEPINMLSGLDSAVYVDVTQWNSFFLEAMTGLPAYGSLLIPGNGVDVYDVLSKYNNCAGFGVALIDRSGPDNRVELDSNGEAQLKYNLTKGDKAGFMGGALTAARVMFRSGAKKVVIPSCENIFQSSTWDPMKATPLTDIEQCNALGKLEFVPNQTIVTAAHLQSANKMGKFEQDAVVSPHHRLWRPDGKEVPNLYVCDSSVFPTSCGANPMQTIYTFAHILVQRLVSGDLSQY